MLGTLAFVLGFFVLLIEASVLKLFRLEYSGMLQFLAAGEGMAGTGLGAALVVGASNDARKAWRATGLGSTTSGIAVGLLLAAGRLPSETLAFVVQNALALVAFAGLGAAIAEVFEAAPRQQLTYAIHLVGSAVGGLAVVLGFTGLGLERTLWASALLLAIVGALSAAATGRRRLLGSAVACGAVIALFEPVLGAATVPRGVSPAAYAARVGTIRWNGYSRIDVERVAIPIEWDLPPSYSGPRTLGNSFTIDLAGSHGDHLRYSSFLVDPSAAGSLESDITALPHAALPDHGSVLVVGSGGGKDVAAALETRKVDRVDAVELNPLVLDTLRAELPQSYATVYGDARVHLFVDDIREFLRGSNQRYDLVEIGTLKNQSSLSSATTYLEENYVYTEDAFRGYRAHMNDDGLMAVTWYAQGRAFFVHVLSAAEAAFHVSNETTLFFVGRNMALLLLSPTPLSPARRAAIAERAHDLGLSSEPPSHPVAELVASPSKKRMRAATDDRPFVFLDPSAYGRLGSSVCGTALAAIAALVLLRRRVRAKEGGASAADLGYFAGLGAAFIATEFWLIHGLTQILGQPLLAFVVGVVALLFWQALGAYAGSRRRAFPVDPAIIAGSVILLCLPWWPLAVEPLSSSVPALRTLLGAVSIAPCGLALGLPFPTALAALRARGLRIEHAFAANAFGTVLGMAVAIGVALAFGYLGVGLLAVATYVGLGLMPRAFRADGSLAVASPFRAPSGVRRT
jgi:hypothetical protein